MIARTKRVMLRLNIFEMWTVDMGISAALYRLLMHNENWDMKIEISYKVKVTALRVT